MFMSNYNFLLKGRVSSGGFFFMYFESLLNLGYNDNNCD